MKLRTRMTLLSSLTVGILVVDLLAALQAEAVYGTRRRTARRTAVVVSSAQSAQTATAQQQAAEAQKEAEAAKQEAAAAQAEAAKQQAAAAPPTRAPAPGASGALPMGTIVHELPTGCTQTAIGGVSYQKCGADYYRAAFQGSQLVYVTVQP